MDRPQKIAFLKIAIAASVVIFLIWIGQNDQASQAHIAPPDRQEVLFWHFWGGEDGKVVQRIVDRFNAIQDQHFVRAIAMPGNNLDLKLLQTIRQTLSHRIDN